MTDSLRKEYGYLYTDDAGSADSIAAESAAGKPPLYYYTTVETFQKIAETGSIFASHIKRMNDWKEFDLGADIVLDKMAEKINHRMHDAKEQSILSTELLTEEAMAALKKTQREQINALPNYYRLPFLKDALHGCGRCYRYIENGAIKIYRFGDNGEYGMDYAFPELYSISFTDQADLLSQWKMYAKESGVAIEFDFAEKGKDLSFLQEVIIDGKDCKDFPVPCTYPRSVKYDLDETEDQIEDALDLKKIFSDVPYYKDNGFRQESEARLVFRPFKKLQGGSCVRSKLGYRTSNHLLIPYLVIYCAETNNHSKLGWPIVSLTVGPGHNQDMVFDSLVHFMEYGDIKVHCFSDDELLRARINYYYEFFASYVRKKKPDTKKGMEEWKHKAFSAIKGRKICSAQEQEQYLFNLTIPKNGVGKHTQAFAEFCARTYLASNGIIIRKSKIPYIFS